VLRAGSDTELSPITNEILSWNRKNTRSRLQSKVAELLQRPIETDRQQFVRRKICTLSMANAFISDDDVRRPQPLRQRPKGKCASVRTGGEKISLTLSMANAFISDDDVRKPQPLRQRPKGKCASVRTGGEKISLDPVTSCATRERETMQMVRGSTTPPGSSPGCREGLFKIDELEASFQQE